MKKIILLVVLLLVCGCSKKLTCTYEQEYEDIKINNKIIFDFEKETYEQKDIMIFEDKDSAEEYFKDIEEYVDEYNLRLENNKIISELNGEIKLDANKEVESEKLKISLLLSIGMNNSK